MALQTTREDIEWFGRWVPALSLVAVAVTQICLVYFLHLIPWKGGGFGMFATIDGKPPRAFTIDARDVEGRRLRLEIPPSAAGRVLGRDAGLLITGLILPNADELRIVLRKLKSARFVHVPYHADRIAALDAEISRRITVSGNEESRLEHYVVADRENGKNGEKLQLEALRLVIWRLRFDSSTARMRWERVGEPVTEGKW